jgi:hypothetical protein
MARAPEAKKSTRKAMLTAEVRAIVAKRPDLKLVKVADGAIDNWQYLGSEALPQGHEAIDLYHASEHLHAALAAAYGDGTHETQFRYATLREARSDEPDGADKVIRALKHLATKYPHRKTIATEHTYFRKNKKRMGYAAQKAEGLMIGSGVVEAACKTLVTQRLKQSGMRWSVEGAEAILTPRGWDESERFDEAWARLAATFHAEVTTFANVVAFKPKPKERSKHARVASR